MKLLRSAVALAAVLSAGAASAASCGSPVVFTVTANVGITCGGFGNGNDINGQGGDEPAAPTLAGYVDTGFVADGALSLTGLGTTSGTWTITPPTGFSFSNLVIAFQGTLPMTNPDWAWFNLAAGALTGTWSIASTNGKTLDRAYIYGQVAPVPLPAALPLFGTALAGVGVLRWVRRRKATAAV